MLLANVDRTVLLWSIRCVRQTDTRMKTCVFWRGPRACWKLMVCLQENSHTLEMENVQVGTNAICEGKCLEI